MNNENAYQPQRQIPYTQQPSQGDIEGKKSYVIHWLLAYFVGSLGVDRMYRGLIGTGVLKLLTLGGFGVWYFVDWLIAGYGSPQDKSGMLLRGYHANKKTMSIVTTVLMLLNFLLVVPVILLVVFLAVPSAQENSRNVSRKVDANIIAAGISEYVSQSNGQLPTEISGDAQTNVLSICNLDCKMSVESPALGFYDSTTVSYVEFNGVDTLSAKNEDALFVYRGAACSSEEGELMPQQDSVAVVYFQESKPNLVRQCISI